MQREKITSDLARLAFDFFYRFSRFEFALKESHYRKSDTPGAKAEACWKKLVDKWENEYVITATGRALINAGPKKQIVAKSGELKFVSVSFPENTSDLRKVTDLAKIVRNNLFHGGKHGGSGWDDPERIETLLPLVISLLGELAVMAGIEGDYLGIY